MKLLHKMNEKLLSSSVSSSIDIQIVTTPIPPIDSNQSSSNSLEVQEPNEELHDQPKKKKKKLKIPLFPTSWLSFISMLWIAKLVSLTRNLSDVGNIIFQLAPSETSTMTGDALERSCKAGRSLLYALFDAFGREYLPLGIWKLGWVAFTWIGNYYFLFYLLAWKSTSTPATNHSRFTNMARTLLRPRTILL